MKASSPIVAMLLAGCTSLSLDSTLDEDAAPLVVGLTRRVFATTACETSSGYLPYIRCNQRWPKVDEWIMFTGTRASIGSKKDGPIVAAWFIGHNLFRTSFTLPMAPGCQLMVEPITVLTAWQRRPGALPPDLRIAAWSEGSTAFLIIRPSPSLLGHSIYVQMGVFAVDENMLGGVISSMIHLYIGNSDWKNR